MDDYWNLLALLIGILAMGAAFAGFMAILTETKSPKKDEPKQDSLGELEPLRQARCPDCDGEEFLGGPEGGICQNIKCEGCGSKFNVAIVLGNLVFAERI